MAGFSNGVNKIPPLIESGGIQAHFIYKIRTLIFQLVVRDF